MHNKVGRPNIINTELLEIKRYKNSTYFQEWSQFIFEKVLLSSPYFYFFNFMLGCYPQSLAFKILTPISKRDFYNVAHNSWTGAGEQPGFRLQL
jgi:hypothetical protein